MTHQKASDSSLPAEELREVAWELGQYYPQPPTGDYLVFVPVRTGLAYFHWSMLESSVRGMHEREGEMFNGASQALRIYDVSLIEFDGTNAHSFFDIHVEGLSGHYYLHSDWVERTLLAEIGFRLIDGRWLPLARSESVFMDRNHRVGHSDTAGLYVAGRFERVFPVENVYDAPVFGRMHRAWSDTGRKAVQVVYSARDEDPETERRLVEYLARLHDAAHSFGVNCREEVVSSKEFVRPDLVHAHNVGAVAASLRRVRQYKVPFVLSLHSTEWERAGLQGREPDGKIVAMELEGAKAADLVLVPHGDVREQLLSEGGVADEKIALLPDLFESAHPRAFDPGEVKKRYHLNPGWPLVLFAGEISHVAGADLLVDAIQHVAGLNHEAQFVLIGEGPLRGELEACIHHRGLGSRVRFTGDVWHGEFHDLLAACDFVVIPARTWQDEGLAHMAMENGKHVVATHQSRIHCVNHGENGLMVYDNPGSIIWGLQEMLSRPFTTGPGGIVRRPVRDSRSLESVAAELSVLYRSLLKPATKKEGGNG